MPPVCPAPVKDVLALLPVDSSGADFSMPDVSTLRISSFVFCRVRFAFASANKILSVLISVRCYMQPDDFCINILNNPL